MDWTGLPKTNSKDPDCGSAAIFQSQHMSFGDYLAALWKPVSLILL